LTYFPFYKSSRIVRIVFDATSDKIQLKMFFFYAFFHFHPAHRRRCRFFLFFQI